MCLSTGIKKLVAKQDITCYKVLRKKSNGTYVTPYRDTKAELNKEIVAANCSREYNNRWYNSIEGGFIHALLRVNDAHGGFGDECVTFKAIIPAGTEFFVNDNFEQICARKMFVTDTIVKKKTNKASVDIIMESILEAYPHTIEEGKVAIGDFCVVGKKGVKTYIHRSEYTPEIDDDIIGVVGFFNEDGKPVVISRKEVEKRWCTLDCGERPLINDTVAYQGDRYKKSLNGKELTEKVLKSEHYKAKKYPLFQYIANFKTKGTKKGDWYVGVIGELVKLAENAALINASLWLLKDATLLYHWLWSSSEYYAYSNAWYLNLSKGGVGSYAGSKGASGRVRAFATF